MNVKIPFFSPEIEFVCYNCVICVCSTTTLCNSDSEIQS